MYLCKDSEPSTVSEEDLSAIVGSSHEDLDD